MKIYNAGIIEKRCKGGNKFCIQKSPLSANNYNSQTELLSQLFGTKNSKLNTLSVLFFTF
ncbi:hypothetical protein HMPREF9151_00278 [Hoylesella saccharolytica F0055]|uniref:Uncharacterized protein n=1 Tax=Hoylesella saccharolytica F0055 TaxID=1127699 RepID=L1NJW7_9BACT|nr:hypothetical protein HMPREF9151_00278 [Hoylesella saccharolytica F0055]